MPGLYNMTLYDIVTSQRSQSNVHNSVWRVWCFPKLSQQVSCNHVLISPSKAVLSRFGSLFWARRCGLNSLCFESIAAFRWFFQKSSSHGKNLPVKVSSGTNTLIESAYFSRLSTWRRSSQIASRRILRKFWLEHLKVLNLRLLFHGHTWTLCL